jgi:very-short-patch-repair endonuclease
MRRFSLAKRELACQLRKEQTPAESILWAMLRNRRLGGLKFRRQVPIGPFIVDFCNHFNHLVIEVDRDVHAFQQECEQQRTAWLETQGYTVIRFTNREIRDQLDAVLETILSACAGKFEM